MQKASVAYRVLDVSESQVAPRGGKYRIDDDFSASGYLSQKLVEMLDVGRII